MRRILLATLAAASFAPVPAHAAPPITAACTAAVNTTVNASRTVVYAAVAYAEGATTTTVRCVLRSTYDHGSIQGSMPGPLAFAEGSAVAPFVPLRLCVSASAGYPDGTTQVKPESCNAV